MMDTRHGRCRRVLSNGLSACHRCRCGDGVIYPKKILISGDKNEPLFPRDPS
jgi:hypothetical protein